MCVSRPILDFKFSVPIAHRANYGDNSAPENTLAAVRAAHQNGAEWVEGDVKITADGVMIVIHDDTLRRTTNAKGDVADKSVATLTYKEIAQFDAGNGEKIPTLVQFLELVKQLKMGLVLEIRPSEGLEIKTARETVTTLWQCGFIKYPKLLVQSFNVKSLREVQRLCLDELNLGLLIGDQEPDKNVADLLRELHCQALVANHISLSPDYVANIKKVFDRLFVLAWTVNNPRRGEDLFKYGVDAVITDHPERFMAPKLQQFLTGLTGWMHLFNFSEKASLTENRCPDHSSQQYGAGK